MEVGEKTTDKIRCTVKRHLYRLMLIICVLDWLEANQNYKVLSALIPGEQRQTVLLDGEPLEDIDKLKSFGPTFIANSQGTKVLRSRIKLVLSALLRLEPEVKTRKGPNWERRTRGVYYRLQLSSA